MLYIVLSLHTQTGACIHTACSFAFRNMSCYSEALNGLGCRLAIFNMYSTAPTYFLDAILPNIPVFNCSGRM